ncbi:MAG: M48 family metallopeptidase [Candidatus Omnitrophica bacterium]|nr:M48 family metallopeptidase [Candidatus Omnitrophota bacterium]
MSNRRYKFLFFTFCFLLASFSLGGCASLKTYNAATERYEFVLLSPQDEVSIGYDSNKSIIKEYKLSSDKDKQRRLDEIGRRLVNVLEKKIYPYHFFLIEKDELNAFTTPGGYIYFFTGLFDKLKTDDAIASVVAHELGHNSARHIAKKFQAALGYNVAGSIIFSMVDMGGDFSTQIASMSAGVLMNIVSASFSRQDEYEADRLGVKYMFLAGYDLNGIIESFEILLKESKGSSVPLWLRTHPFVEDRIESVKEEIVFAPYRYNGNTEK